MWQGLGTIPDEASVLKTYPAVAYAVNSVLMWQRPVNPILMW
jgi:hypothetical protein